MSEDEVKPDSNTGDDCPVPFHTMLYVSNQIYKVARMRKIIRKHDKTHSDPNNGLQKVDFVEPDLVLASDERDSLINAKNANLSHPISGDDVVKFVMKNRKFLYFLPTGQVRFNEDWDKLSEDEINALEVPPFAKEIAKHDADIWEFDDKFPKSDMVYGAVVNRSEKRVTIVFRGSVTKKDWKKCLQMFSTESKFLKQTLREDQMTLRNKIFKGGDKIKIHQGFSNYVFKGSKHRKDSKFEDIVNDLEDIFSYKNEEKGRDYSDYSLYVTGHSLGGALAQLVSFALAARDQSERKIYNYPVHCISFASPRVGKKTYRIISEEFERKNLLTHIRVTTEQDCITAGPWLYEHTGINVHLYDKKEPKIGYKKNRKFFGQVGKSTAAAHGILEYRKRLADHEKHLHKSVKQFYRDYANLDTHEALS